jgi:hypothetical protein
MTQSAFLLAKFLMRFDAFQAPNGQDNLERGLQNALVPKNDVKLRFHVRV